MCYGAAPHPTASAAGPLSDAFDDFAPPPNAAAASAVAASGALLDLDFFGSVVPSSAPPPASAKLAGMADMLASLEALDSPQRPGAALAGAGAWFAHLPDLCGRLRA